MFLKNIIMFLFLVLFVGCGGEYESHNVEVDAGEDKYIYQSLTLTLDASNSNNDGANIVKYTWTEDNTTVGNEKIVQLNNVDVGEHIYTLTIEDEKGHKYIDTIHVNVLKSLITLEDQETFDSSITLNAVAYSDKDKIKSYAWYDQNNTLLSTQGSFVLENLEEGKSYPIILKLIDTKNILDTKTITLTRNYTTDVIIQANDAGYFDYFGNAVAIDGDTIVVGAYQENTTAYNVGSVYVFEKDANGSVVQVAKIQASDAEEDDYFGNSVAIDGDTIVVGAYGENTTAYNAGSVYVFEKDANGSVEQIAKIQASDAEESDLFGNAVAIDGDTIVVGAYGKNTTANDAGSVYVFEKDANGSVVQIAKIQASDAEYHDYFGNSVAIDGDTIVVGAYGKNTTAYNAGNVYLFEKGANGSVVQIAKIQASDAEEYDRFGNAVAIDGDTIVVGAYGENTTADYAEYVYVFEKDANGSVVQVAKIQASDAEIYDHFGGALAIDGDTIVVGAKYKDTTATDAGSVYLFEKGANGSVEQIAKIQASDAEESDLFGNAVAIDGDTIVVGAYGTAENAGSAYIVYDVNNSE